MVLGGLIIRESVEAGTERLVKESIETAVKQGIKLSTDVMQKVIKESMEQAAKKLGTTIAKMSDDMVEATLKSTSSTIKTNILKNATTIDNLTMVSKIAPNATAKEIVEQAQKKLIMGSTADLTAKSKTFLSKAQNFIVKYPKTAISALGVSGLAMYCAITGTEPTDALQDISKDTVEFLSNNVIKPLVGGTLEGLGIKLPDWLKGNNLFIAIAIIVLLFFLLK